MATNSTSANTGNGASANTGNGASANTGNGTVDEKSPNLGASLIIPRRNRVALPVSNASNFMPGAVVETPRIPYVTLVPHRRNRVALPVRNSFVNNCEPANSMQELNGTGVVEFNSPELHEEQLGMVIIDAISELRNEIDDAHAVYGGAIAQIHTEFDEVYAELDNIGDGVNTLSGNVDEIKLTANKDRNDNAANLDRISTRLANLEASAKSSTEQLTTEQAARSRLESEASEKEKQYIIELERVKNEAIKVAAAAHVASDLSIAKDAAALQTSNLATRDHAVVAYNAERSVENKTALAKALIKCGNLTCEGAGAGAGMKVCNVVITYNEQTFILNNNFKYRSKPGDFHLKKRCPKCKDAKHEADNAKKADAAKKVEQKS
jgi:hypothetical protein